MSINTVNITGNLVRDPEVKMTKSNTPFMEITVAVNERKNNGNGDWEDYPNYIDCTLYGSRAEAVARYISKGSKVSINGKLHQDRWEKDGQKRTKLRVVISDIEFMSKTKTEQKSDLYDEGVPF